MDCGAPRFVGPGAKKIYEYIMKNLKKPRLIKNLEKKNVRSVWKNFLKSFTKKNNLSAGGVMGSHVALRSLWRKP